MNTERIKKHFKDNQKLYIGIGVGLLIGGVSAALIIKKVNVTQVAIGKNITQIAEVHLARRGHPGFVVQCDQTGEIFASQRRASDVLGINRFDLWKHLKGQLTDVNGLTFTVLREAKV